VTGDAYNPPHRLQPIVEAFSSIQGDLHKDKKAITKHWAKRDEQIPTSWRRRSGCTAICRVSRVKTLQEIEKSRCSIWIVTLP